jgi:hypothetical protein
MSAVDDKSLASQQRRDAIDAISQRLRGERPGSRLSDTFGGALVDLGEELCGRALPAIRVRGYNKVPNRYRNAVGFKR